MKPRDSGRTAMIDEMLELFAELEGRVARIERASAVSEQESVVETPVSMPETSEKLVALGGFTFDTDVPKPDVQKPQNRLRGKTLLDSLSASMSDVASRGEEE